MRTIRLLLLVLVGVCGTSPCFAQPALQLVWWPLVTDGQEYRRVPYPQEAGALLVLADTDIVVEARLAPVTWWPITREYLADFSRQPQTVDGSIEVVDGAMAGAWRDALLGLAAALGYAALMIGLAALWLRRRGVWRRGE